MEVPGNIINFRRELCNSCKTPCEHQKSVEFRSTAESVCPVGRWKPYQLFVRNKWKGAGDAVAAIAQPIAGVIDRLSRGKTKVRTCSACAKRKEMLNQLLPFGS